MYLEISSISLVLRCGHRTIESYRFLHVNYHIFFFITFHQGILPEFPLVAQDYVKWLCFMSPYAECAGLSTEIEYMHMNIHLPGESQIIFSVGK